MIDLDRWEVSNNNTKVKKYKTKSINKVTRHKYT